MSIYDRCQRHSPVERCTHGDPEDKQLIVGGIAAICCCPAPNSAWGNAPSSATFCGRKKGESTRGAEGIKGCSPTPWAHSIGGQGIRSHPRPALNRGAWHSFPYQYRTSLSPPQFPLGLQRSWEKKPRLPGVGVLALNQLRLSH